MEPSNKTGLDNIENMYKNLTYFDQYGSSVIILIIITIIVIMICVYCYVKTNVQPIIDDWPNQRCKPYYIPFAGLITKPTNMTAMEYTRENFNYCTQNVLASITGFMVEPITFITHMINSVIADIKYDVNYARVMFDNVRTSVESIAGDVMGRIMNIMIPLQKIIISFRDMFAKMQGAMTAGIYTLIGAYYSLQALMGSIAEFIIIILIAIAAMIIIFWLIPFTWGLAGSMTAIFVAISIPLALMLAFMLDVLNVQPDLSIPTLKCFDKDTMILMKDGTTKPIKDILVGDLLYYNEMVTAKIKVETKGSIMYKLNDVIVSDTHLVHFKGDWIKVWQHPNAIKINQYDEPYLYCLNTSSKTLYINNTLFSDWDDLVNDDFTKIHNITKNKTSKEIHEHLDSGFIGSTKIPLRDNTFKELQDVQIGDILLNNEQVYGIVEIDGKLMRHQFQYILGKTYLKGGPNIVYNENNFCSTLYLDKSSKFLLDKKEEKLYHLLTDTATFTIDDIEVCDYNGAINFLLNKQ